MRCWQHERLYAETDDQRAAKIAQNSCCQAKRLSAETPDFSEDQTVTTDIQMYINTNQCWTFQVLLTKSHNISWICLISLYHHMM
jgi:hypothetical protein